jgi:hypothetical protein
MPVVQIVGALDGYEVNAQQSLVWSVGGCEGYSLGRLPFE